MNLRLLILIFIAIFSLSSIKAQQIKHPLPDKETNVSIPESPSENMTWVKPHWEFINMKYEWVPGKFIENKEEHTWIDAFWERDQKTGWYQMNSGYWRIMENNLKFSTAKEAKQPLYFNMKKPAKK